RNPWWRGRLRAPAPLLAPYMARGPPAVARKPARARDGNNAPGLHPREPPPPAPLDGAGAYLRRSVPRGQGRTYPRGAAQFARAGSLRTGREGASGRRRGPRPRRTPAPAPPRPAPPSCRPGGTPTATAPPAATTRAGRHDRQRPGRVISRGGLAGGPGAGQDR